MRGFQQLVSNFKINLTFSVFLQQFKRNLSLWEAAAGLDKTIQSKPNQNNH